MKIFFLSLAVACIFFACSKSSNNDVSNSGETDFSVYLADDPAIYDEVNIDIESVEVHYSDDNDENAWHTLTTIAPGVHNLLRLANGKDTLLAKDRIAAKKITQIRFILGTNNTVVVGGVSYPLETPSAQESGLKFDVDVTLTAGIEYKLWTDFDASRSIVVTGNNKYILKPVIRVYTDALTGSISGVVLPAQANAQVYLLNGNDTIASTKPDAVTGTFMINGLAAGSYTVEVDGNNNFNQVEYDNIQVTVGNVTLLSTTTLHE